MRLFFKTRACKVFHPPSAVCRCSVRLLHTLHAGLLPIRPVAYETQMKDDLAQSEKVKEMFCLLLSLYIT